MKKLNELYEPKARSGKKFVAMHKGEPTLKKSKPTQNDDQFNSGKVKTFDRSAKRMGYNTGADEKAYDGRPTPAPNDQGPVPTTGSTLYPSGKFAEEIELTDDDIDTLLDMLGDIVLNETSGRDFARGVNPNHPATTIKDPENHPHYSKVAVDKAIASSTRSGRKVGGKEAKAIHRLLKGWRGVNND